MGYNVACFNQLSQDYLVDIIVIQLDHAKLTPYNADSGLLNGKIINKSTFENKSKFIDFCIDFDPNLILISGWMDEDYLKICRYFIQRSVEVVSFLDNQWQNTYRQRLSTLFPKYFFKRNFTKIWGAGRRQFEFAKKIGYTNSNILSGCFSADSEIFNKIYEERNKYISTNGFNRTITFLGRLNEIKGLRTLTNVFLNHYHLWPGWKLVLIGNGPMKDELIATSIKYPDIMEVKDFVTPDKLILELRKTGIFCLPSIYEPWGVVIHEMAAAGIPMICSDICGAADEFVKENFNGFLFRNKDNSSLLNQLNIFLNMSEQKLIEMGHNSHVLSVHVSPKIWASTAYSLLLKSK